ncbi:60S ribosomal protein L29 [Myotis brandtii]|uniref:60S ribosomal protein L29 n=1 Tax=Myotis brandtii TaxID=109478 RepID=S7MR66_MYOBR|nr:60S ribosomal protein L29 [Myotis brandtii]
MKANKAKAMSAHAKAIKTLVKANKVKIPKLSQLAYLTHPKFGRRVCAFFAKGLRFCQSKSKTKAQTKSQAPGQLQVRLKLQLGLTVRLPKVLWSP